MSQTSVETIQKQIDFEIEKFEIDFNNGVEWSMRIMFKSLERIKRKAEQAKEMHNIELGNAFEKGWEDATKEIMKEIHKQK